MTMRTKLFGAVAVAFLFGVVAAQSLSLPPVYGHEGEEQGGQVKGPKWQYGLGLQVRNGKEDNFSKDTKKFGVEVFRDENNGNLIYMTETGSIAVVPAK
jgi:hypothetical protein